MNDKQTLDDMQKLQSNLAEVQRFLAKTPASLITNEQANSSQTTIEQNIVKPDHTEIKPSKNILEDNSFTMYEKIFYTCMLILVFLFGFWNGILGMLTIKMYLTWSIYLTIVAVGVIVIGIISLLIYSFYNFAIKI